jgi:hypothetical protein
MSEAAAGRAAVQALSIGATGLFPADADALCLMVIAG